MRALRDLNNPVVIAAFSGWNDAGNAASDVLTHIEEHYNAELAFELDSEDYYDFQVQRPDVVLVDGQRQIVWPCVAVRVARLRSRDVVLIRGPEPNMRWRTFVAALLSALRTVQPELVIVLGAMLTDAPHSRPLPVAGTCTDAEIGAHLMLEESDYTGPTGVTGVFSQACQEAGFPVVSLWVSVPHYVASAPNPKATLALLARVEDALDTALDLGDLPDRAQAWQRGVDELASEDPDIAEYITQLETEQDSESLPEASGDVIAAEFQRFLRRRQAD